MAETLPLGNLPSLVEAILDLLPTHEKDFWSCSEIMPPKQFIVKIKDEIWGELEIPPPISYLFTAPAFIRTTNVKQLSTSRFIFGGAVHSRLSHQIGVYYILSNIYEKIVNNNKFKEEVKKIIRERINNEWLHIITNNENYLETFMTDPYFNYIYDVVVNNLGKYLVGVSAILHDIGHGGWGHVFDSINGLIFRMLKKAYDHGAFRGGGFLTQTLLEIQKLDITSATYVITSSEQIRLSIKEGFNDIIDNVISNIQPQLNEPPPNNHYLRNTLINIIKELNSGFHLLDIIITIITEDITITKINGRLHNKALSWYQGISVGDPSGRVLFAIVSELLYIIAQLGIQLLGDVPYGDNAAGINSDRLDWIPRDIYHLGVCNDNNNSNEICNKLNELRGQTNNLIENPLEYLEIESDLEDGLIYLTHKKPMHNLRQNVIKIRENLYNIYHNSQKTLYDSILVRSGFAVVKLIQNVAESFLTRDLVLRLTLSYILNNDESFINDTLKILRSAIGSPILQTSASSNRINNIIFNNINLTDTRDNLVNILNNLYNNYRKYCNLFCEYSLQVNYAISTANLFFTKMLEQPFLLTQLSSNECINLHIAEGENRAKICVDTITFKDLKDYAKRAQEDAMNRLINDYLLNNENCETYNDSLREIFRQFSDDILSLELPFIEYILNNILKNKYHSLIHVYINYIHYPFKDLISFLSNCKGLPERLPELLRRPVFTIFVVDSNSRDNRDEIFNIIKLTIAKIMGRRLSHYLDLL